MNVILLEHTPEPEKVIAAAARLCYSKHADVESLLESLDDEEKVNAFVEKLESLGHESPMEHVSFTFAIEGVSRALLAQHSRHRIASLSVRSQRYCSEEGFSYVTPDAIKKDEEVNKIYDEYMEQVQELYKLFLELGVANEDARMILPNACCTRMMVTMNIRALLHFFQLRCCQRAQQEIRDMAYAMLKECKKVSPVLFKHAGPTCVKGYCPEGSMSCGRAPTLDMLIKSYKEHH